MTFLLPLGILHQALGKRMQGPHAAMATERKREKRLSSDCAFFEEAVRPPLACAGTLFSSSSCAAFVVVSFSSASCHTDYSSLGKKCFVLGFFKKLGMIVDGKKSSKQ
ncbi:UNVERIFIED_CONTAM: hypothetical protein K2H54_042182 [Gekko kuhli]